ncbi:MAG TPA: glycoside hydrolase [Roseiflexaceae bacterium]|nr:glycoside hydrolase [Roseiflexaceae bacterium]
MRLEAGNPNHPFDPLNLCVPATLRLCVKNLESLRPLRLCGEPLRLWYNRRMDDAYTLALTDWELRPEGEEGWRAAQVPGCWEDLGVAKDWPGPVWYRALVTVPATWAGRRIWLRFGAVSYHCQLLVNGTPAGEHTGMWDAFEHEIGHLVAPGEQAELLLRVEKPASLTAGPDSPTVPGRFPLRETLAGFLPYVWGHAFGGIWQPVALFATGPARLLDAHARGGADGRVTLSYTLSAPAAVELAILAPDETELWRNIQEPERTPQRRRGRRRKKYFLSLRPLHLVSKNFRTQHSKLALRLPDPMPWSPERPALYTLRVRVVGGEERALRFGLRTLRAEGATLLLNGAPLYPRLILSWGWYPDRHRPDPGPERVRADFARLRALGYNGVKLCLWFPPPYYFDIADEQGMLLWVELPMWLPRVTPHFRRQVPLEYERLVRQARPHPSVIIYTLGCELNRAVGAAILGPLFALVKRLAGDALVRDNSGSGEAYGGLLDEHAEFYDYHFYSELPFLRGLIDAFSPRWRPAQPWLFGEFCDYDSFREPQTPQSRRGRREATRSLPLRPLRLRSERSGTQNSKLKTQNSLLPWWASRSAERNPQGARWQYELPWHAQRLAASGYAARAGELERLSAQQGLLHRKYTLELVRSYGEITGYVVTGEADTPVSTAGMWDDQGRLKHAPEDFRAFNGDLTLLVGWGKRRAWVAGGDRFAPWDVWCYQSGAPVRAHLIASHYGRAEGPALATWEAGFPGESPFASGAAQSGQVFRPGTVREVAIAEFRAPDLRNPRRAILRASLRIGPESTSNTWPLWLFPHTPWAGLGGVALHDPVGRLADLQRLAPHVAIADDIALEHTGAGPQVIVATCWSAVLDRWVREGGAAVLLQTGGGPPGPFPTVAVPFWREAVKQAEAHPAWGDFPLDEIGTQFFGCAPDCALDTGGAPAEPILRRLDTRSMAVHDYATACRWGTGRLIVTTLRLEGGQGEQPLGLGRSPAANHLLSCWVRHLLGRPAQG